MCIFKMMLLLYIKHILYIFIYIGYILLLFLFIFLNFYRTYSLYVQPSDTVRTICTFQKTREKRKTRMHPLNCTGRVVRTSTRTRTRTCIFFLKTVPIMKFKYTEYKYEHRTDSPSCKYEYDKIDDTEFG